MKTPPEKKQALQRERKNFLNLSQKPENDKKIKKIGKFGNKIANCIGPLKSFINIDQKIRIRLIRLKLNKSQHIIAYNFLKEILSEGVEEDKEKKQQYVEKIKIHLNLLLFIKEFFNKNEENIQNPLKIFEELENTFKNFKDGTFMQIYSFFTKARVYYTYEDYHQALVCIKSMEFATLKNNFEDFRLIAYFYLGKTYQSLRVHKKGLKYYLRTLQLAWKIHDINQELLVYDHLGLMYYYMGNLETAKTFHDKMVLGETEKDQEFKKFSIRLYNLGIKNSAIQKKFDKTFKKALVGHIDNRKLDVSLENKPKVINHELNIELKKLEKEGKISNPTKGIGEFIYKNEGYFKKKMEKWIRRIAGQKGSEIQQKRLLTHCSFNRNHENFEKIGFGQDKYMKISYKSNFNNQKAVTNLFKKITAEINNGLYDLEDFASLLEKDS